MEEHIPMESLDVAVVGGGPAGSTAAREAAIDGLNVAVFEKGVRRTDREELGPDSTDAAGILDYWLEIMQIGPDEFSEIPVLQEISYAEFNGPNESFRIDDTGLDSWYDGFGFTFDRRRMDDLLKDKAEDAGAEYRAGESVKSVVSDIRHGDHLHKLTVSGGEDVEAEYLVLADGPQRRVTIPTLEQFTNEGVVRDRIGPRNANHIAYQEHRRFPDEEFESDVLRFWWGLIPGETAYPWYFPNDDNVVRWGLTMPIDLDLSSVTNRDSYKLLRDTDETVPQGRVYLRRLLEQEYGDRYDIEEDFPLVEDRGKDKGTESYPISSTNPIDSPTRAGVAVVGGAMGATSAFHEGGYHLAVRTGKIAGTLIRNGGLEGYNEEWKEAVGPEIARNVCLARLIRNYAPRDFDRVFRDADIVVNGRRTSLLGSTKSRLDLFIMGLRYKYVKRFVENPYVQIREEEYSVF